MGKKDPKHSHKKKSYKKKHKKEKKKHKEKKLKYHKKNPDISFSDSSTSSDSFKAINKEKKFEIKSDSGLTDESEWRNLFSDEYMVTKTKSMPKKNTHILDKPGQSVKELNPYWKYGGDGLPPLEKDTTHRNYDAEYLKNLSPKAKDKSILTDESVDKVKVWTPQEKSNSIINARDTIPDECYRGKLVYQCPKSPTENEKSVINKKPDKYKDTHFMKPGESFSSGFTNSYRRNWKKKVQDEIHDTPAVEKETTKEKVSQENIEEKEDILTPDQLNALVARAMKAEIMGNQELYQKLQKEIEVAKNNREKHQATSVNKTQNKTDEIVVLTKSNSKGSFKPYESPEYMRETGQNLRKRKGETHHGNDRVRYFLDDDKHSLKSMFEKEKFGGIDQSDELLLKLAKRGKLHKNDDNDLDDDFIDRVRDNNYERIEQCRERSRILEESRTKHKSLSNCRWCLDGNYIQKHLIVSVGNKCYLCLPSDESLTDGHCLIVPVFHETCGTLLDEDVWSEMLLYRKALCRMFQESKQDVVFFENARSFNRFPHMIIHCIPMDKEIGDMAPIYFKKAIMESETEWSNNKKIIELKKKDLRRSVPKGLSYFAVDFGEEGGFAHIIEDEKLFPSNFAEEVIGGMLDLDVFKFRKKRKQSLENQKEKVADFLIKWKKYDFMESNKIPNVSSDIYCSKNEED